MTAVIIPQDHLTSQPPDKPTITDSDWPAAPYVANWYCAVINGKQYGLLLGPYPSISIAERHMHIAVDLAQQLDPYAWFYTYALANAPHTTKPGLLNHLLDDRTAGL